MPKCPSNLIKAYEYLSLPARIKLAILLDRLCGKGEDPGMHRAIREGVQWLGRAQDMSPTHDGGVARDYSLLTGWNSSYPETTGYIVPTMLACAEAFDDADARTRAKKMLDWLVSIQMAEGGFQGGLVDAKPAVPVTFNTGQILMGLASGVRVFGDEYRGPMRRAADWLVATQDEDGCWRRHGTPFASPGEKTYETHVAWGLLEAAQVDGSESYLRAARANIEWALRYQRENGWFEKCCLTLPEAPLTHTLGYVLRGLIEAHRFTGEQRFLEASIRTADGLLSAVRDDGALPGRIDCTWRGTVSWACLTGCVQVAHCWLELYLSTSQKKYRDAAFGANRFVRCTMKTGGDPDTRGAVKGSFPVDGGYGQFEYLNWAVKFFIDSHLLEMRVRTEDNLNET